MSYAQIGDEALLQADYRKGEDSLAEFEAVTPLANAGATAMAQNSWNRIWIDAWSLGFEASCVIGLRCEKIAAGDAAARTEVLRMVGEKIEASLSLLGKALNGGLGITALSAAEKTLDHYRQEVRANETRLAKVSSPG